MKHYKNKIIAGVVIALMLALAFWLSGNTPSLPTGDTDTQTTPTLEESIPPVNVTNEGRRTTPIPENEKTKDDLTHSTGNGMEIDLQTGQDAYKTDPVPEGMPVPVEPENTVITDVELTCTLSVKCDTILSNINRLAPEKVELVPKDGVIYAEKTVTFYAGESVFHLLLREMKRNKIHMEFENTPIYNSAYIEGIANLYEFDCGELSGWMYRVNGWFPNYGCSRYQLKAGDKVEWVYTCDLGRDVGGHLSARNGNEYE